MVLQTKDRYIFLNESDINFLEKFEGFKYVVFWDHQRVDGVFSNEIQIAPEIKDQLKDLLKVKEIPIPKFKCYFETISSKRLRMVS